MDSPSEQEILISRLVARIAELEERLFQNEFEQPSAPQAKTSLNDRILQAGVSEDDANQQTHAQTPVAGKEKGGFFAALKEGLRQLEESTGYTAPDSRIVYYEPAPPEVQHAVQAHAGQSMGVETSKPSTTNPDSSWFSRLGLSRSMASMSGSAAAEAQQPQPAGPALPAAAGPNSKQPGAVAPIERTPIKDSQQPRDSSSGDSLCVSIPDNNAEAAGPSSVASSAPSMTGATACAGAALAGLASVPATPGAHAQAQTQAQANSRGTAGDWFSSLFRKDRAAGAASTATTAANTPLHPSGAFNEKAHDARLLSAENSSSTLGTSQQGQSGSYYRYVFDPVDVEAEMEVTARVRKAAAEALTEANERVRAAQEAQAALQRELEQFRELHAEVARLQAENSEALRVRRELEEEMTSTRTQLEGMRVQQDSVQQELEGMRAQADIWRNAKSDEQEKVKQENQLLRKQLQTRLTDLSNTKSKLADAEADKARLQRDLEEQMNKVQWLQKINLQLENSAQQLDLFRKQASEFQDRFMKERNVRRKLHEQLQVLRGNIRVMCRVRPIQQNQRAILSYPLEGLLAIAPPDRRAQEFEFDHVFAPEATQQVIYEEVSPLVRSCADGFNVCIFAYGQTGSGKTHTMEGKEDDAGINVRALQELFAIVAEESGGAAGSSPGGSSGGAAAGARGGSGSSSGWSISVSMMEIYNDAVHDLLVSGEDVSHALEVSALGAGDLPPGVDRVPGLTWRTVSSLEEVKQVLREGSKNRSTAATALNAHSSRSHALLSVRVTVGGRVTPDGKPTISTLHLVDLAGSERVDKSEVTGQQLKEAQNINKSLSALGDVISALQRRSSHIPFRNSKLTQVLQDSLCGSSKVLLVCNLSPEAISASETMSSLNFASRAAQVELGQARKAIIDRSNPADRIAQQQQQLNGGSSTSGADRDRPSGGANAGSSQQGGAAGANGRGASLKQNKSSASVNKMAAGGGSGGGA